MTRRPSINDVVVRRHHPDRVILRVSLTGGGRGVGDRGAVPVAGLLAGAGPAEAEVDVVGVGGGPDIGAPALLGPVGGPDAAVVDDVHHTQTPDHGPAPARKGSARNSHLRTSLAAARSPASVAATPQSQARPSLCSLRPPTEQSLETP